MYLFSVNAPPYFNMSSKFYAIQNTELQLQIIAVDPEYQSLKYSVLSNGTMKASIDIDRRLTVTVEKSGNVYVKIEDDIGQTSTLDIQIIAVQCLCQNGGKCIWQNSSPYPVKSPTYTCTCVESYTGKTCGVFKACENVPCYPGLNCLVTADGFSCEKCPKMFEGDGKDCTLSVHGSELSYSWNLYITVNVSINSVLVHFSFTSAKALIHHTLVIH